MAEPVPAHGRYPLRRSIRRARLEVALTSTGSALILGAVIVGGVLTHVLGLRGVIEPGIWPWTVVAGLGVLAGKVVLDLTDRTGDADLWRRILTDAFGEEMRSDGDVARQARMAIEYRVRLASAASQAASVSRRRIAAEVARVDDWLGGIVELARRVAAQRGEARFQAGLAQKTRQRIAQVSGQAQTARDAEHAAELRRTAEGLEAQLEASEGLMRFLDSGYLQLEQSVATLGTVVSQLLLVLSQAAPAGRPAALDARIAAEIGALEREISALEHAGRRAGVSSPSEGSA